MAIKRLWNFVTATTTEGVYAGVDKDGNVNPNKTLWPHHIVATLPAAPVAGFLYYLTVTAGIYPKGLYSHDGTGWVCIHPAEIVTLPDFSGTVDVELVSGAKYLSFSAGPVSSFKVSLTTTGSVSIRHLFAPDYGFPATPAAPYSIRGANGWDAFASPTANEIELIATKASHLSDTITYGAIEITS